MGERGRQTIRFGGAALCISLGLWGASHLWACWAANMAFDRAAHRQDALGHWDAAFWLYGKAFDALNPAYFWNLPTITGFVFGVMLLVWPPTGLRTASPRPIQRMGGDG